MEIVVLIIAIVVGIDALAGVRAPKPLPPGGRSTISTQKIVIDLSKRL